MVGLREPMRTRTTQAQLRSTTCRTEADAPEPQDCRVGRSSSKRMSRRGLPALGSARPSRLRNFEGLDVAENGGRPWGAREGSVKTHIVALPCIRCANNGRGLVMKEHTPVFRAKPGRRAAASCFRERVEQWICGCVSVSRRRACGAGFADAAKRRPWLLRSAPGPRKRE